MKRVLNIALALTLACGFAVAQEEGVLLSLGFEEDTGGFATMDKQAQLAVTREEGVVYGGEGSLEMKYSQRPVKTDGEDLDLPGSLILPLAETQPQLAGVSFAVSSDSSVPILVLVAEGDGGPRYNSIVWCEAGAWHEFALSLDEFQWDNDSPQDPDGKPTPEKINAVVIVDISSFFLAIAETAPFFIAGPLRDQALRLDDFKLLAKNRAPKPAPAPEGVVPIADYEPPLKGIVFLGGRNLVVGHEEMDDATKALKIDYAIPARTLLALVHRVRSGSLADVKSFRFRVKSNGQATLLVGLEERRGPGDENKTSYNAIVTVQPGAAWQTITVPISDFKMDQNNVDPNGKLDLEMVDTLMIGDVSAMGEEQEISNTLWLDELVAVQ